MNRRQCIRTGSGTRYLTAIEAAQEIGFVTPATIARWCQQGRFPGAFRIGRTVGWRIPRSSWERFKKDRRAESIEPGTTEKLEPEAATAP